MYIFSLFNIAVSNSEDAISKDSLIVHIEFQKIRMEAPLA